MLIGGVAAVLHGSPLATFDLDLVPARERQNLDRLSTALTALDAKIRTRPGEPGLAFGHDGRSLGDVTLWNLVTPFGDLNLAFVPTGTTGYGDLIRAATLMEIDGIEVHVASIEDIIRSKRAANRPKDRAGVDALEAVLEEQRRAAAGDEEE